MWIAYERGNPTSIQEARAIRKRILQYDNAYKGGLELEVQDYEMNVDGTSKHKFAGTYIYPLR